MALICYTKYDALAYLCKYSRYHYLTSLIKVIKLHTSNIRSKWEIHYYLLFVGKQKLLGLYQSRDSSKIHDFSSFIISLIVKNVEVSSHIAHLLLNAVDYAVHRDKSKTNRDSL